MTTNKPVQTLRDGVLKINIWANETKNGTHHNADGVVRSYTDKDGKWQSTRYLSNGDLLRAARLLEKAYDTIRELREADKGDQE